MTSRNNLVDRLVTVVLSDPWHTLHLIEIRTKVRRVDDEYRVDINAVSQEALRIAETRPVLAEQSRERRWLKLNNLDVVGVLVAWDDPLHRGRITWAKEVETREAVSL